jgi:hypothetical protein
LESREGLRIFNVLNKARRRKIKVMFELTQYRRLEMDSLFKGYANSFITDDELDFMLDITLGELGSTDVQF